MNPTTQISLLGVLFILLVWVTLSVIRTAARKKRSPLGIPAGARVLRFIVCGAFVAAASFSVYDSAIGISTGKIMEAHYTRFISSHVFIVNRADEPDRFWTVIYWNCFFTFMFLSLAIAEIMIAIKRSMHAKKPQPDKSPRGRVFEP